MELDNPVRRNRIPFFRIGNTGLGDIKHLSQIDLGSYAGRESQTLEDLVKVRHCHARVSVEGKVPGYPVSK